MFKIKTATDLTLLLTPILVHEFNFVFELRGVVHVFLYFKPEGSSYNK